MESSLSNDQVSRTMPITLDLFISLCLLASALGAQEDVTIRFQDPEELVQHLYDQVTFPKGSTPDWQHIRTLFIADAVISMRTSKEEDRTLSLDGWILDFVNFIHDRDIKSSGFEEKVVKTKSMVFGDIAHVLVLYTALIPGVSKSPHEGVDSFHLARINGEWKIISILNEIPGPENMVSQIFD